MGGTEMTRGEVAVLGRVSEQEGGRAGETLAWLQDVPTVRQCAGWAEGVARGRAADRGRATVGGSQTEGAHSWVVKPQFLYL